MSFIIPVDYQLHISRRMDHESYFVKLCMFMMLWLMEHPKHRKLHPLNSWRAWMPFLVFGMLALRKHFQYSKSNKNNIKSDPGAHDVIWMTFPMVCMLALSQYSQHSINYKIAPKMMLELMMHSGVIFYGLVTNSTFPWGGAWIVFDETLNTHAVSGW